MSGTTSHELAKAMIQGRQEQARRAGERARAIAEARAAAAPTSRPAAPAGVPASSAGCAPCSAPRPRDQAVLNVFSPAALVPEDSPSLRSRYEWGSGASAEDGLLIGLLGPVEVRVASGTLAGIAQPMLRMLVAMLAIAPGRVVSDEALVDALWGEEWSRERERNLHSHVSAMRRLLAAAEPGRDTSRLVRSGSGYRLDVSGTAVDAGLFGSLAARGRTAVRDGDMTAALTAFADLTGQADAHMRVSDACAPAGSNTARCSGTIPAIPKCGAAPAMAWRTRSGPSLSTVSKATQAVRCGHCCTPARRTATSKARSPVSSKRWTSCRPSARRRMGCARKPWRSWGKRIRPPETGGRHARPGSRPGAVREPAPPGRRADARPPGPCTRILGPIGPMGEWCAAAR